MSEPATIPLRRLGVALALCTSLALGATVSAILVVNARRATQEEVTTAFELAAAYLDEFRTRLQQGPDPMQEALALARQFDQLRHIDAAVIGPDGRRIDPRRSEEARFEAPDWFVWLLSGERLEASAHVTRYPNILGSLVLTSDVRDEADEVWSDFRAILFAVLLVSAVAMAATFLTLHLIRRALASFNDALRRIGEGDLGARPAPRRLSEFAELRRGIDRLAGDIGARQAENRLLQQRLMTLSDSERRQVASDLHDGLGPLLFALRVSVAEAEAAAGSTSPAARAALAEEVHTIGRHTAAIQSTLRAIIYRLRPLIESGATPVELLADLAASFAEIAPEVTVHHALGSGTDRPLSANTGLALTRFVQESALNAVRHGGARTIGIAVEARPAPDGSPLLVCRIVDDGVGPAASTRPGHGQAGIMDRAVALGGRYHLPVRRGAETVTEIELPWTPPDGSGGRTTLADYVPDVPPRQRRRESAA